MNKKIIFYLGSLARGGAERVAVNLAEAMQIWGYQVTIATPKQAEVEYDVPKGVKRILVDLTEDEITTSRVKNFFNRIFKLRRFWKEEKPELIVSFAKKNNFMAIASSLGLHIPVLAGIVSAAFREYPGKLKWIANLLFPMASGVIAQTPEQRDYFCRASRKKTIILPNAMNPDFIGPVYEGRRDNRIVAVGRVDDNKNHIMLVKAFEKIADKHPNVNVEIFGDGDARKKLQKEIDARGLSDRVILAGHQADIKSRIKTARVFVLTSIVEGVPNAMMEAMALGLVPISTDFGGGGAGQLITDGVDGFIVPVDDVDAMAEKMDMVLSDKELEERLRSNAIKLQERLNPEVVNKQWKEYFETFLLK